MFQLSRFYLNPKPCSFVEASGIAAPGFPPRRRLYAGDDRSAVLRAEGGTSGFSGLQEL